MITDFHGDNFFLDNFFPLESGITTEHLFQAEKPDNLEERMEILAAPTPGAAKMLGNICSLRKDWEEVKTDVMRAVLRAKFMGTELEAWLIDTGSEWLIEGNTWNDKCWGAVFQNGRWVGENRLGILLMELRTELQKG